MLRLPDPCLVVLVGATGSGKSHWAREWFHPDQVVSSDRLRAVVGTGERDQRASKDAFDPGPSSRSPSSARAAAASRAGVQTAIVPLLGAAAVRAFTPVVEAFRVAP